MPGKLFKAAAIVGAAEANEIGFLKEPKSSLQLHIEAIKNVSEQTGIPISRIEGIFSTGWSSELCEHLGLKPKYIDTTACGGCSFEMHVHHALAAIYAGVIDVALVTHGENGHSQNKIGAKGRPSYGPGSGDASPALEMTVAHGLGGAPSAYAHAMVRHMHRYGTTTEDFAHIAKVSRDWATLNPRAAMYSKEKHPFGGPITVEQVEQSRLITWPLTILHCCMVTDHGGAVLIASPKVADGLKTRPVWIAGAGEHPPVQIPGGSMRAFVREKNLTVNKLWVSTRFAPASFAEEPGPTNWATFEELTAAMKQGVATTSTRRGPTRSMMLPPIGAVAAAQTRQVLQRLATVVRGISTSSMKELTKLRKKKEWPGAAQLMPKPTSSTTYQP